MRIEVRGACEMLGLDPLYVANEGKLIAVVPPEDAERLLAAMRRHPLGRNAAMIGTVIERASGHGDAAFRRRRRAGGHDAGRRAIAAHLLGGAFFVARSRSMKWRFHMSKLRQDSQRQFPSTSGNEWREREHLEQSSQYRQHGSGLMFAGLALLGLGAMAWYLLGDDVRRYMRIRSM